MRCPYCHLIEDRVIDTRSTEDGYMVRRKRMCLNCNRKFSTVEKIEKISIRVVKANQTREPLDREKIRRGIERACSKRSVPSNRIEALVQEIESEIYTQFEDEVTAAQVGEIVMRHLGNLDEVAYIRFASVYRDFENAADFVKAIGRIENAGNSSKRKINDEKPTSEGGNGDPE
jgi:transcriptional repressor NrdR